jgi:trehalose 6-phosphate phosphatase
VQQRTAEQARRLAIAEFLPRVASGPSLLALDFDGTLAPFRKERMEARISAPLVPILNQLRQTPATRLVVVSGRPIDDLEAMVEIEPLPEMYGVHGWEHRLEDGARNDWVVPQSVLKAVSEEYARLVADGLGERLERKSAAIALHWRGLSEVEHERLEASIGTRWRRLAEAHGLDLRPFDGGVELRHPGRNKGDAMNELLASMPSAAVAYLGDDETDEDAFLALVAAGDRGLPILVAEHDRTTAARARLNYPEVLVFLREWLQAAESRSD